MQNYLTECKAVNGDSSQQFVVASEPTLSVISVGTEHVSFSVRSSIPVEGAAYGTKRDYYTNFATTIEQLEALVKHVKNERAKLKRAIQKKHDEHIKSLQSQITEIKNARKAEASKA